MGSLPPAPGAPERSRFTTPVASALQSPALVLPPWQGRPLPSCLCAHFAFSVLDASSLRPVWELAELAHPRMCHSRWRPRARTFLV